eukprot:4814266-Prymnesium_polylepis.1
MSLSLQPKSRCASDIISLISPNQSLKRQAHSEFRGYTRVATPWCVQLGASPRAAHALPSQTHSS